MCDVGEERDEMRHGGIRLPRERQRCFGVAVVTLKQRGGVGGVREMSIARVRKKGKVTIFFSLCVESVCFEDINWSFSIGRWDNE